MKLPTNTPETLADLIHALLTLDKPMFDEALVGMTLLLRVTAAGVIARDASLRRTEAAMLDCANQLRLALEADGISVDEELLQRFQRKAMSLVNDATVSSGNDMEH